MVWDTRVKSLGPAPKGAQLLDHAGKPVFGLCTAGKGRTFLATASLDKTVRLWEPVKGGGFKCTRVLTGHTVRATRMRSQRALASPTAADLSLVPFTNQPWPSTTWPSPSSQDTVNAVTAFGDSHILSGASDSTLRLWSLADGTCEKVLRGHKGAVLSVSCLEKSLVLTGSTDRTARIWCGSGGAWTLVLVWRLSGRLVRVEDLLVACGLICAEFESALSGMCRAAPSWARSWGTRTGSTQSSPSARPP